MSLLDWTRSETISKPDIITISWTEYDPVTQSSFDRKRKLSSTTKSVSTSKYETREYVDADGKVCTQDVVTYKEDVKTTTQASVNQSWITDRLKTGFGLPMGNDIERSVTTYEYKTGVEGPELVKDTTEVYISMAAFAGQLQGIPYSWSNPYSSSQFDYYDPIGPEVLAHRTVNEYKETTGGGGRPYTRTKTSRWVALGQVTEAKEMLAKFLKGASEKNLLSFGLIRDCINDHRELKFEGTEVQVNIGRAPVPSKPSDPELTAIEVTNGNNNIPSDATPTDVYGNNVGWPSRIPPGTDWQSLNKDSNGDGTPDWAPYVPDQWQDYNQDSNNDGTPDWADYVPDNVDWQDFNQDSNNDGTPDWSSYVPPSVDWQDFNQDSNGDGVPDWAAYVPPAVNWEDVNTDSNNDGVPDWAQYVPSGQNWQDYVTDPTDPINTATDSNNDGTPDWADLLPTGNWQDYVTDPTDPINTAIDSNNDGTPDWADNLPSGNWQDYVTDPADPINTAIDSNGDGTPDWANNLPGGNWQDYVTDPTDWQNTAIDRNNDGVPDWADNTPIGWQQFASDTNYSNPEPQTSNEKAIKGQVVFDGSNYNNTDPTVTASYEMPFAPDDYFSYEKRIRKLVRGNAAAAAEKFGRTEAALDIGHAYGQNIVTGFNETPTLELSPLYIRLAGIEGAFLLDGTSYAWGPEGMVVSSDLMLIGVSGYDGTAAPATSWLRLPVAPASIGPASGTTVEASPVKANSIAIPGGFSARNPGPTLALLPTNGADVFREWKSAAALVPPSLVLERETIGAGSAVTTREFPYGLTLAVETAAIGAGAAVDFIWLTTINAPAAAIAIAGVAPAIKTGTGIAAPSAVIQLAGLAPTVSTGVAIRPPSAAIGLSGRLPVLIGFQRITINVPAASIAIAGCDPLVASGASATGPVANITIAGLVPTQIGAAKISVASITYSQSSVYTGTTAASNAIMTDGSFSNTGAATNVNAPAWIKMDLGASYAVAKVIVGTATSSIPGGWNKSYTENKDIEYSSDDTNWTKAVGTGTFAANGIYTFNVSFTARYIRLRTPGAGTAYIAASEFYALAAGQTYP